MVTEVWRLHSTKRTLSVICKHPCYDSYDNLYRAKRIIQDTKIRR